MDHDVTYKRIHMVKRCRWEVYDFLNSVDGTLMLKQNKFIKFFNQFITFRVDELHVEGFFISFGMPFQIIVPGYEMLSLNILRLGFGFLKF